MLILTRNTDESIFIGKNIKITLLSAKSGRARIGIEAPQKTAIYREEILEKIKQAEQEQSVKK